MKPIAPAIALALTLTATALADAESTDEEAKPERKNIEHEMDSARAELEAARAEVQRAAKKLAEAARARIGSTDSKVWQLTYEDGDQRAFLGILIGGHSEDGIVVGGVTPAGGAEAAGLKAKDLIVAIDGESLTGHERPLDVLHGVLGDVSPGGDVTLTVSRDGEVATYEVATTPRVEVKVEGVQSLVPTFGVVSPAAPLAPVRQVLDVVRSLGPAGQIHLVDIGEDLGDYFGVDGGVLVLNAPGKGELKPGDIVRRIDDADVASAAEAHRLLAASPDEEAEVEVRRKNRKVKLTVAKGAAWMGHKLRIPPKGKARVIVGSPEGEVDIEVEADAD